MKKYIITIILVTIFCICFYSCKKDKNNIKLVKTVEFKTGFVGVFCSYMGCYYDNDIKQDFIYFSDFGHTCIKTFDITGKHINTIPLKNAIRLFKRKDITIIPYSKDTIFLLSHHDNNIMAINNNGIMTKYLHIDDILDDSSKNMYQYLYFIPYQINSQKRILLKALPIFDIAIEKYYDKKEEVDPYDYFQHKFFYSYFVKQPHLLQIQNFFSDSVKGEFIFYDYYKKLEHTGATIGCFHEFDFKEINNKIILISGNKNKIFVADNNNFEYLKEATIVSNYTNIGFQSVLIEKDIEYNTIQNDKQCYEGSIANVFYNNAKKQYYVIVKHKLKNKKEWINYQNGDYRPFSIITYDENFENPKEYKFEANTYICRNSIMTQEGLMIQRKPEKLTKENYGTQTFDLLEFN